MLFYVKVCGNTLYIPFVQQSFTDLYIHEFFHESVTQASCSLILYSVPAGKYEIKYQ